MDGAVRRGRRSRGWEGGPGMSTSTTAHRSTSTGLIRVWAIETRGAAANAYGHCRYCRQPVTWMTTVKNLKRIPLNGHDPVPLQTERDQATGRLIEIHGRDTVHFETCEKRPAAGREETR